MNRWVLLVQRTCFVSILLTVAAGPAQVSGAVVYQISNDSAGESTFVNGTRFSPAGAPTSLNDYVSTQYLMRTPENGTAYTFAGKSLTLGDGTSAGTLFFKNTANTTITVNNLISNKGMIATGTNNNAVGVTLAGTIAVQSGGLTFRP